MITRDRNPRDKFEEFLFNMLDKYCDMIGANGVDYPKFQKAIDDWNMPSSPDAYMIYGDTDQ